MNNIESAPEGRVRESEPEDVDEVELPGSFHPHTGDGEISRCPFAHLMQ